MLKTIIAVLALVATLTAQAPQLWPAQDFRDRQGRVLGCNLDRTVGFTVAPWCNIYPSSVWIGLADPFSRQPEIRGIRFYHPEVSAGSDVELTITASFTAGPLRKQHEPGAAVTTVVARSWRTFTRAETYERVDPGQRPDVFTDVLFDAPLRPGPQPHVVFQVEMHDARNYVEAQWPEQTYAYECEDVQFRVAHVSGSRREWDWARSRVRAYVYEWDDWRGRTVSGNWTLHLSGALNFPVIWAIGFYAPDFWPALGLHVAPVVTVPIGAGAGTTVVPINWAPALERAEITLQSVMFDHTLTILQVSPPEVHTLLPPLPGWWPDWNPVIETL